MKIQVVLEPCDEGGYTALVPALPGCISEGDTKDEAIRNVREAIRVYLEPVEDDYSFAAENEVLKLTVPAHKIIKRSTLSHIIKQAHMGLGRFLDLV